MGQPSGTRVTGVDEGRRGWVAVSLEARSRPAGGLVVTIRVGASLGVLLTPELDQTDTMIDGIDMPLGLRETGWPEQTAGGLGGDQLPGREPALP